MMVLSYIPSNTHPPNEGVRRGAVGSDGVRSGRATNRVKKLTPSLPSDSFRAVAATKRETPAFCGRPGPIGRMGEGFGGWGHAHPALGHSTRRDPCGSCLESFRACGAAPQERRIALSILRTGYPSACGDTLGREKRGAGSDLCALLLLGNAPRISRRRGLCAVACCQWVLSAPRRRRRDFRFAAANRR